MNKFLKAFGLASIVFLAIGCGGSDDDSEGGANGYGGPACVTQSDCGDNAACVTAAGMSVCQPVCTGSIDECGASASCGGVGAMSINVCQPAQEETPAEEATEEDAPAPEEQPSLPCATDADCSKFDSGAICAQWDGVKDCTIPCTEESDCDIPAIGGFSVDFMTCIPDEADTSRMACLPDENCFADVMSCVTLPSMPGMDGLDGLDGLPTGDSEEEGGEGFDFDF